MKRLTLAVGLVALAAVIAACTGVSAADATPVPVTPGTPAGDAVSITAKDLTFAQTQVSVKAGRTPPSRTAREAPARPGASPILVPNPLTSCSSLATF